jgi:DNA processing protein
MPDTTVCRAAGLERAGYVAALAGLPAMGPRRLGVLLAHHSPVEAYEVACGRVPAHPQVLRVAGADVRAAWVTAATGRSPDACAAMCAAAAVEVLLPGDALFPPELALDHAPPAALFVRGDLAALDARRVGVVGTRNATRSGLDVASQLGAELAEAGVTVVSGLARGVDGAAHRGALTHAAARPAAIVGNGPDVVYPREHRALMQRVVDAGVLVSEWPPGTRPDPFRFPLRNRILAALCEVVVVVESRERGGSLLTAREAIDRSVPVMAVPGSPRNRAAAGTNLLICEGATPVTDAGDVLVALGLHTARRDRTRFDPRPPPSDVEREVLARCRADPATLDEIAVGLDLPLAEAAMALARLERSGWLRSAGGWFEAVGPPVGMP